MSAHDCWNRSWASTWWTKSRSAISVGSACTWPDAPYASASECAASVDSTRVRSPPAAASAAVPAATVDLPTPPLPVKRRMRTGDPQDLQGDQAPDSTRFLRPFNAVSIRIFSPLRLSMPMSGIETSRASR